MAKKKSEDESEIKTEVDFLTILKTEFKNGIETVSIHTVETGTIYKTTFVDLENELKFVETIFIPGTGNQF